MITVKSAKRFKIGVQICGKSSKMYKNTNSRHLVFWEPVGTTLFFRELHFPLLAKIPSPQHPLHERLRAANSHMTPPPRWEMEAWIPVLGQQDLEQASLSRGWSYKVSNSGAHAVCFSLHGESQSTVRNRKPALRKKQRIKVARENPDSSIIPGLTVSSVSCSRILRIYLLDWTSWLYLRLHLHLGSPAQRHSSSD